MGLRRRTFFLARVGALLLVLTVVAAWAFSVRRGRRERAAWDRTLEVGVVLLIRDPSAERGAARVASGLGDLARRMAEEMERHRGPGGPPFEFSARGPVSWSEDLPLAPASDGPWARAGHALRLWRALRRIEAAAGPQPGPLDARIYVLLDPPSPSGPVTFAEGAGAVGGEVGLVRTWTAPGDATLALAAIGHELLHCLGAGDKYDPAGHALEPEGLVEPGRSPRYPQRQAEWMAGEIPLARGRGRLPTTLDELAVGTATAREIGWLPPAAGAR